MVFDKILSSDSRDSAFTATFFVGNSKESSGVKCWRIGRYYIVYKIPDWYKGGADPGKLGHAIRFQQGFRIDFEGRARPFVVKREKVDAPNELYVESKLYDAIELSLEPIDQKEMTLSE